MVRALLAITTLAYFASTSYVFVSHMYWWTISFLAVLLE